MLFTSRDFLSTLGLYTSTDYHVLLGQTSGSLTSAMLWLSLLLLCPLPLAVAAVHEELVNLAAAGRGVIKLDPTSYELLISGNRNWSASIEFTALDPRHACGPCKFVLSYGPLFNPECSSYVQRVPRDLDGGCQSVG